MSLTPIKQTEHKSTQICKITKKYMDANYKKDINNKSKNNNKTYHQNYRKDKPFTSLERTVNNEEGAAKFYFECFRHMSPIFLSNESLIFDSPLTISFALILCSSDFIMHSIAKLKIDNTYGSLVKKSLSSQLRRSASTVSITRMGN